jgi:lysozyme family protein
MADFALALPYVLKHEGGFVDDADDPGGATNHGITLAVAQRHGVGTVEDLKAITDEKVAQIYRADYWRFNGIQSQQVATKLFDMAVNMGVVSAVKLAQECLNDKGAALSEDGLYGFKTEACVNAVSSDHMLSMLCEAARGHYLDIVVKRPKSMKFLGGWLKRAVEIPEVV